jgi:hypothetical protein
MDAKPSICFVTASLKVDCLHPTPLGVELEGKGNSKKRWKTKGGSCHKSSLLKETVCVCGEVVRHTVPESMKQK